MAKRVFFSFNYEDVKNFKVNVVRNSWIIRDGEGSFVDSSIWESAKSKGVALIKNLIDSGLKGTSVTAVLIGEDSVNRRWVNYEIIRSFERGNGLLGIHINRIAGRTGPTVRGLNPLDRLGFEISKDGKKVHFYELNNKNWVSYADLPIINNKQSNTLFFEDSFWSGNEFGKFYRFSDKFSTKCWDLENGYKNLFNWVEIAVKQAGK
ncbi:hypothetical protein A3860_23720 [Niastella vici]|uniref:Thoeris protein ThsB TIR-like domain-containing protein n=1 Tax=Niastella vici TaxID=1703345 RepID=A0A1V9FY89_9BACT|nr:TIR domain-containing protein [Niastella vici]OQP63361.1 hypothetical protein A3860_23720 [Niastella vici]